MRTTAAATVPYRVASFDHRPSHLHRGVREPSGRRQGMLGDLSSPMLQRAVGVGSKRVQHCRLAAALVCTAVVVLHITLLWILQREQSGYESSSMVYCEVEGDDMYTGTSGSDVNGGSIPPCMAPGFGETCCPGPCGYATAGRDWDCGPLQSSFEWKVSSALGSDCKLWGSQFSTGPSGYRQPMLCPADMQKGAKRPGFCNVPPTQCTCSAKTGCFASPKD